MTSFPNKIPNKSSINELHIFGGYPLVEKYANKANKAIQLLNDKYYLVVDFFCLGFPYFSFWAIWRRTT